MDLFTIDAVDMVSLTKVVVEYEGDGQGKGWFLEKVIVKDSANPDFQYTFNCDRCVHQRTKRFVPCWKKKCHFMISEIKTRHRLFINNFALFLFSVIHVNKLFY